MTWASLADAFTNLTDLITKSLNVITGNEALLVVFVGGLVPIGFRIFKKAKRAVR